MEKRISHVSCVTIKDTNELHSFHSIHDEAIKDQNDHADKKDENEVLVIAKHTCFYSYCSDLSTTRGQNSQLLKIIALTVIPIFILIIESSINIAKDRTEIHLQKSVQSNISFSVEVGLLVHFMQIERGTTALYISSNGSSIVMDGLIIKRTKTDSALNLLTQWTTLSNPPYFASLDLFKTHLQNYRDGLNPYTETIRQAIKFYSDDNDIMIGWVGTTVKNSDTHSAWQDLISYHMLLLSKEQAGIERALGSTFYARGSFPTEDLIWYTEKKTLGETYLDRTMQYSEMVKSILNSRYTDTPLHLELSRMRAQIMANNGSTASVTMGITWFENMTSYINILKDIQDTLAEDIITSLGEHIDELTERMVLNIIEVVGMIIMLPIIIYLVYRLTKKLQIFANSLKEQTDALEVERKRSEQLLHQMLPIAIAKQLVKNIEVVPEHYDAVTIYFSDIVGFTTICSKSTPMQVIKMLNLLYSLMDDRLEYFDVYKVETIGDAYMVASGLPVRNQDKHSYEIASMAIDIIRVVSQAAVPHIPDEKWKMRIGINTGSVVAGVVGSKMPRYCLFGDTVNVASRMESNGKPAMIHISASTKSSLEKWNEFHIRERGQVTIKGKGLMTTYWLLGKGNDYISPTNIMINDSWCNGLDFEL